MKTTAIFTISFLFFISAVSAQSVTISPNSLDLPRVSVLPTCSSSAKGKMLYNTTDNKMYYCNGANWINTEVAGTESEAAFSAFNSVDVEEFPVYEQGTYVTFNSEVYDVGNNFLTSSSLLNPSSFIAPANGVYHFDAFVSWHFSAFVNTNFVSLRLMVTTANGMTTTVGASATFPAVTSPYFGTQINRDIKLNAGEKVRLLIADDVYDTQFIKADQCFFSGHLVTKHTF